MFISNSRTSFHLWWKKNLIKYWKVSKYYETDCRFNGVYSRANLPERSSAEIKDEEYIINTDEYSDIGIIQLLCTCKIFKLLVFILSERKIF